MEGDEVRYKCEEIKVRNINAQDLKASSVPLLVVSLGLGLIAWSLGASAIEAASAASSVS